MDNNNRHKWTENEFRVVCSICKMNNNNTECEKLLKFIFPTCSKYSIKMIIDRYNTLITDRVGWGDNIPQKFRNVWNEQDWRR
jgi:hypothetical protein